MFIFLCWLATLAGSTVGLFILAATVVFSDSAPQQAAGAALAVGCAAIPYVFSRACESLSAARRTMKADALDTNTRLGRIAAEHERAERERASSIKP